jgi:hypothetical protein
VKVTRRIAKLEKFVAPIRGNRFVVRFEGPGSETFPQPTKEEMEDARKVFTVCFVAAKDERPV